MIYTAKAHWEDMSKIYYSPYYLALTEKQHGAGVVSERDFLDSKVDLGKAILAKFGENNSTYLQTLLYVSSLASAPFGRGGRKALAEKYGYDKKAVTLTIAKAIGLSPLVIEALDASSGAEKTLEDMIAEDLEEILADVDVLTEQLKQEILDDVLANKGLSDNLYNRLTSQTPTPEQAAKTERQKAEMQKVITQIEKQGMEGDPLMYILGTKESDFVKRVNKSEPSNS